jgi:phage terminase large subunit
MDIVVNPACANLIRELRSYAYRTDPRTGEILPVIEDKNNHLIDALRYAVEGLHRRGKRLRPEEVERDNALPRPTDYRRDSGEVDNWKVA